MGLSKHSGMVKINANLSMPVSGNGASAPVYHSTVGDRLNCEIILQQNKGVTSASGAIEGRVIMRASGTATSPVDGQYRVHLPEALLDLPMKILRCRYSRHICLTKPKLMLDHQEWMTLRLRLPLAFAKQMLSAYTSIEA